MLNRAIQRISTLPRIKQCSKSAKRKMVESSRLSRLESLLDALRPFYGVLPPLPRDPFILFVWEVLAVHSTPQKRDAAIGALKRMRALTPDSMWRAPQKKLEESVRLAGPYTEQRLQALRTGVDLFRRSPDLAKTIRGPLPAARRALKPLPQLGETGAHRMLLFAADQMILPVDARVSRVARRLGYGEAAAEFRKQARSVQIALESELPPSIQAFRTAFLYLSHHGGATCTESDPHCVVCPLLSDCPEGKQRTRKMANG
jgi:endonuclease-3